MLHNSSETIESNEHQEKERERDRGRMRGWTSERESNLQMRHAIFDTFVLLQLITVCGPSDFNEFGSNNNSKKMRPHINTRRDEDGNESYRQRTAKSNLNDERFECEMKNALTHTHTFIQRTTTHATTMLMMTMVSKNRIWEYSIFVPARTRKCWKWSQLSLAFSVVCERAKAIRQLWEIPCVDIVCVCVCVNILCQYKWHRFDYPTHLRNDVNVRACCARSACRLVPSLLWIHLFIFNCNQHVIVEANSFTRNV